MIETSNFVLSIGLNIVQVIIIACLLSKINKLEVSVKTANGK